MTDDDRANFIRSHGVALHRVGYDIVRVKPFSKRPHGEGWQQTGHAPVATVAAWAAAPGRWGVGVLTGTVVAIDIDTDHPQLATDIVTYCQWLAGPTAVRRSRGARRLLVYRTRTPAPKRTSPAFFGAAGDKHQLEVLGVGQQFVAYGIHPDTRAPYRWDVPPPAVTALPWVDGTDIDALLAYFAARAAAYGLSTTAPTAGTADLVETIKPPLDISDDYLAMVLAALPADDYDEWLQVGMALHHQYGGSELGLQTWHTWSRQSAKYDAAVLAAKWPSFATARAAGTITVATLIQRAGIQLTGADPLAETLTRYVYLAEGDCVADLQQLPHTGLRKMREFVNLLANVQVAETVTRARGKPVTRKTPVSRLWLTNPQRKTAIRRLYRPGKPRLLVVDGAPAYNMFAFPPHETTACVNVDVFLTHIAYLFPREAEREWFLDWLAHAVQRPWERPQIAPLHISRAHGTGRGMLVKTLHKTVGLWNCRKTSIHELVAGPYTDYLYESLFAFIEEARERGSESRYEVNDKMRDKLTDDVLAVNVKHGYKGTTPVYTRILMMSNHLDSLTVPVEDRRINVFDGPEAPQSRAYYDRYLQWLAQPGAGAAVFRWLQGRDIRRFYHQRSMDTPARQRMIDYNRNDTETTFFELLENPPQPVMTFRQVVTAMETWAGNDPMRTDIRHGQVKKLLQEHCYRHPRQRINGVREWPWQLSRGKKHTSEQIRALLSASKN